MGHFRVGISGWTYAGWRGVFYPERLPHKRALEFARRHFNSLEINRKVKAAFDVMRLAQRLDLPVRRETLRQAA